MKKVLSLLFVCISFFGCIKNQDNRTNAFDFIPEKTDVALRISNLEAADLELRANDLLNASNLSQKTDQTKEVFSLLGQISTDQDIVIAFNSPDASRTSSFVLATQETDSLFVTDSLNRIVMPSANNKTNTTTMMLVSNDTLFSSVINGFFIASNNKETIQSITDSKQSNKNIDWVKELDTDASMTLYALSENDAVTHEQDLLGEVTALEMDIAEDYLYLNGITRSKDTLTRNIDYLKGTEAQPNLIATIVPESSNEFWSYTFNDFAIIDSFYKALNGNSALTDENDVKELINEVGFFKIDTSKVFAIRSIDVDGINESINSTPIETIRQVAIEELDPEQNIDQLFHPFFEVSNLKYVFVLGDFLVFTNNIEAARETISSYTNKSTLSNSSKYSGISEKISEASTLLYFKVSKELDSLIANNLPTQITERLGNNDFMKEHSQLIQLVNDQGFAHVNILIQEVTEKRRTNSISEEFTVSLDKELLNDPQIVKNHVTGQKDLIVQDIENNLYLISNRGKVRWKKKLNGNILGKVEQMDIYKNGRLQLVFATPNELHVLDRNGKAVSPFPLKFQDEITQPLSVFDYDNNRNYRLLVVQDKDLLMYDSKGKKVNGFNFKAAEKRISSQPRHFRVGNKDYIVFASEEKLNVLNRKGQTRVAVNERIEFSENDIFLYRNKFTSTNTDGQLIQVDQKGRISKQNLLLPEEHALETTSKTMVTLADNKLTIKGRTIELDFGDYTAPRIFYLRDKIYVSVTDLQSQKVYLFDSQAKPIPNFPVYGNSAMELVNIDKDRKLEFVVKGDNNTVILYQIN
ncbi:MAG: hypothetical protein HKO72_10030 [Flavobacteriaceae bacterium]|nr:hypothetical protein [Bacteroidia bacterium]NNL61656.1 hypothetical protein [Flavobacteriaceae bacterium]